MKKIAIVILVVLLFNAILIFASVKSGVKKGDITLKFQERQAVTFVSALLLGLTSLTSLVIYLIKKKFCVFEPGFRFWLFSSIGFFYLSMDEYFMAHEGLDKVFASLIVGLKVFDKKLELDGITIGLFGLIALAVCIIFRRELLKYKESLLFLFIGGACLVGTVAFDLLYRLWAQTAIVVEESFKILGVSFFFASYFLAFTSFIKKAQIAMRSYNIPIRL